MLFFIMNSLLMFLSIGMIFVAILLMQHFQKAVLSILLCCRPNDRRTIKQIVINRLESGHNRNNKIAVMIAAGIAFLILHICSQKTMISNFGDLMYWSIGSDLIIRPFKINGSTFVNEIPMVNFLDEHRDIVEGYMFHSVKIDLLFFNDVMGWSEYLDSEMWDLSDKNKFTINIYA